MSDITQKPTRSIDIELEKKEFILTPNPQLYIVHNKKDMKLWNMFKQHQQTLWVTEEIKDLNIDARQFPTLSASEQGYIKTVLAFFASADGIILENLGINFIDEVKLMELRAFYAVQMYMEQVHSETYSVLLNTYIQNEQEKQDLFNALETVPSIQAKAKWALKWTNRDLSFAERLLAFICVECIFFSGSFTSIFWIKRQGKLPGLTFSNELISRDEGLHVQMGCIIYSLLQNRLTQEKVHEIVSSAVEVEKEFVKDCLKVDLIGLNDRLLCTYIEYVADRLLLGLGYSVIWNAPMELDFMEKISLVGKTNFFERPVGEYKNFTSRDESNDNDATLHHVFDKDADL